MGFDTRGGGRVKKNILVVLSELGYWGEELIGPLETFDRAGYEVTFVTPHGRTPTALPPSLDPEYVGRLATYVDEKIRAAADATPSGDLLRLTIIAALNIADELFRCRDVERTRDGRLAERAGELERLLDRLLMA